MEEEKVRQFIKHNAYLKQFIEGDVGCIEFKVSGVPIIIYKKNVGVEPYYKLPYNPKFNYAEVVDFMKYAIPILSQMLEKERGKQL